MQNTHRITQLIGRAALVAVFFAPALAAQERRLFTWRGAVDDDVRIAMRAGNVQSTLVRGSPTNVRERIMRDNVLPHREGTVRVELIEGRGVVRVIQQPTANNRYTTIIQVKDSDGGASRYRFATYFTPSVAVGRRGERGPIWESVGGDVDLRPGSRVFRWSGNVDGSLHIKVQRASVDYNVLSGAAPRNVSATVVPGGLPERAARLSLVPRLARGIVTVVQQPSASNGYTAVVQVNDQERGFGYYDFDLVWR